MHQREGVAAKSKMRKELLVAGCFLDGSCFLPGCLIQPVPDAAAAAQFLHSLRLCLDESLFFSCFIDTGI